MKGFIASALLGVLLALPVAAQIAGSGQRTQEAEEQLAKARKAPPAPVSSPRAVPKLSGAPQAGKGGSTMRIVDVQAVRRMYGTSGVRVFRGDRVSVVRPGMRRLPSVQKASSRRSQMKLIRIGASPRMTYTGYGIDLAERAEEVPVRPPTIRINP
ncbi:MAG: hypothetical protein R3B94_06245 [Hyphomonas sp.]